MPGAAQRLMKWEEEVVTLLCRVIKAGDDWPGCLDCHLMLVKGRFTVWHVAPKLRSFKESSSLPAGEIVDKQAAMWAQDVQSAESVEHASEPGPSREHGFVSSGQSIFEGQIGSGERRDQHTVASGGSKPQKLAKDGTRPGGLNGSNLVTNLPRSDASAASRRNLGPAFVDWKAWQQRSTRRK